MASKASKKRILACQDKAQKIIEKISSPKTKRLDLTELTTTLKFAYNTFLEYTKTKSKDRPPIADEGVALEAAFNKLDDIFCKNPDLKEFMRKKVDLVNAQIYKEVAQIYIAQIQKKALKKSGKKEPENDKKPTMTIKDEDGRRIWETNFEQTLMVPWKDFLMAYRRDLRIDGSVEPQLHYVLDNSNTGFLSIFKFADFLQEFGPFKDCIQNLRKVLSQDYFHGFLSHEEATKLLENKPPTSFLVRFSKSKTGFALAYVELNGSISHTHITSVGTSKFKVELQDTVARCFGSIQEVIDSFPTMLRIPVNTDLTRQEWFHGDLSNQEAAEVLAGEKDGTFLFRFSSRPKYLAISYVQGTEVKHGLLECLSNGQFRYENQTPMLFTSLEKVITGLSDILKFPLKNLTFLEAPKPKTDNNNQSDAISPRTTTGGQTGTSYVAFDSTSTTKPVLATDPQSGYMMLPSMAEMRLSNPPALHIASPAKLPSTPPLTDGYNVIPKKDPVSMTSPRGPTTRPPQVIEYDVLPETSKGAPSNNNATSSPKTSPRILDGGYDNLPVHSSADGTKATPPRKPSGANADYEKMPIGVKKVQSFQNTPSPQKEQAFLLRNSMGTSVPTNYNAVPGTPPRTPANYNVMPGAPSNYNQMPSPGAKPSPTTQPPPTANYATLPAPSGTPVHSNYSVIPTPGSTPQNSNPGTPIKIITPTTAPQKATGNYGFIPAPSPQK